MGEGERRVAIVGGGISGLAAAERLAALDNSLAIDLLEAGDRLGGVLQTEQFDGFCLEQGPDSMLSRLPWGVDLCRRIGFKTELVSTNSSPSGVYVVARGRLERVPAGLAIMAPQRVWPMVTTPILSWRGKLRLAAEWMMPRRRGEQDESLADFSRRRLGRETLERLVQPLAGGIYMGDPERLSIRATFPQFVEMEQEHGSLIRAARAERAKGDGKGAAGGPQYSLFVAPRRGMAQLVDALAERLGGCRVRCRQRVESIRPEGGGWRVEVVDGHAGDRWQESYAGVILALPAIHAGPLLAPVEQELGRLLGEIPYAGCVVVNAAYERGAVAHPLDSFGFVTPHIESRSVLACTFSHLKYPGRAPGDKILFRAFLGGACFPEVMEWPDERVLQAVEQELHELVGASGQPLFTRIKRWERAMPQYHVGHLERVRRIEELAGRLPGLELAGNYFRGVGIPQCIHSGGQASERVAAAVGQKVVLQQGPEGEVRR
jgi:protoporphyrinogen/coproporphyrinogen III oxidase